MKLALVLHLVIGVCMMAIGLLAGVRPYALLDVVLTQEQLRNRELADSTLSLLQRGAGNDSWWMFGAGVVLVASSIFAIIRRTPHP